MGNPDVRYHAARTLCVIGPPAVPDLAEALTNPNPDVRWNAAVVLGRIDLGDQTVVAVRALIQALGDPSVSYYAGEALGRIGSADAIGEMGVALPAVIAALKDPDPRVRASAATALGLMGSAAAPAVPRLVAVLKDTEGTVNYSAAEALGRIGPLAAAAVPDLIEAMGNPRVRYDAVLALGRIGPGAIAAVPALTEARNDPDRDVGDAAVRALGRIDLGDQPVAGLL
jgi:HEAT repeat protein